MGVDDMKKKSSRDAARQRRGQQNDEYSELALQLPLPGHVVEKMDRLCVMRLSNSFIKIKHVLDEIKAELSFIKRRTTLEDRMFNSLIQKALDGFVFVLAEDGQCLYISPNVSEFLGLQQLELTGHSIYKYVHPCDQDSLAKQLGGHVPLADMEIFDGLFCSDIHSPPPKQSRGEFGNSNSRSFSLRMKSTLTSRGKSVNVNASIHRVVQCTGVMKMCRMKKGISNGAITRCFLGVGIPLLCNTTFEVPLDRKTFMSKHSLDFTLISIDDIASDIIGYSLISLKDKSWYTLVNVCDLGVLETCHKTVLQQGQSVSSYYRIMVKKGGWVWLQTKASMVYNSATHMPAYIMCVQYVISGVELPGEVLSLSQLSVLERVGRRRKMDTARDYDMAGIHPPRNVKVKMESKGPTYKYDLKKSYFSANPSDFKKSYYTTNPSPCIPFPLHDIELNLCSLDDDTPPPSPVILPGGTGIDVQPTTFDVPTSVSPAPHTMEVKQSLKEISLPAPIVRSKEAHEVQMLSLSDDDSVLDFDEEFLLSNICDDYGNLEFGECSPIVSDEEVSCFGELEQFSNANVSSLFLFHEEASVGDESDLFGMISEENK